MNEKPSKLAEKIYNNLLSRINEALEKESWNPAYELAFEIGLKFDIDEILIKEGFVEDGKVLH